MRSRLEEERRRTEELRRGEEEAERSRQREIEEQRRKDEEETRKYEQAVREAIEEGRKLAQERKTRAYVERGKDLVLQNKFEEALKEVTKIFLLNPSHEKGRQLERMIYASRQEYLRREEEARQVQEEQQRKLEELCSKLEEQAREDKEDVDRKAIRSTKIAECLRRAQDCIAEGAYDNARSEIETLYAIDPGNMDAQALEMEILTAQQRNQEAQAVSQHRSLEGETWRRDIEQKEQLAREKREQLKKESIETYRGMVRDAWVDGRPGKEEQSMLDIVRQSFGVDDADHAVIEMEMKRETFTEALRAALRNGVITEEDRVTKENLRAMYAISSEDYLVIESRILHEDNKSVKNR